MPLKPGSLDSADQERIQRNYKDILDNMHAETIMDYFVDEEIFEISEVVNEIDIDTLTKKDKNRKLIDLLMKCSRETFPVFIRILKEHEHEELAVTIETTLVDKKPIQVSDEGVSKLD